MTTTPRPPIWTGSDEQRNYYEFATKGDALAFIKSLNLVNLSGAICTQEGKHVGGLVKNRGLPWHLSIRK